MRKLLFLLGFTLGCAADPSSSLPTGQSQSTDQPPALSNRAPVVTGTLTGDLGGSFTFFKADATPIATCAEILSVTMTINSRGNVSGSENGAAGETCIYLVNDFGWQPGSVSGPGNSPIAGPITGKVSGSSVTLQMQYQYLGTPQTVTLSGKFFSPTHLVGTWTCTGQCGSAGGGAQGWWRMDGTFQ